MNFLDLLLIALGGWRFAYLITSEDGPGNVMGWIREQVLRRALVGKISMDTIDALPSPGSFGKGLTCFRCMSVWGALIAWALLLSPLWPIVWIAAGSAAAILVSEYVGMGFRNDSNGS